MPACPGSIAVPVLEGRPLIIEVQGLVGPSSSGTEAEVPQGIAPGRLALLLAVLKGRRCHLALATSDVFVSTVGGLRVNEPAADLAVALALVSAVTGVAIGEEVVACGEVGLAGELRQVPGTERRLAEAARLGFHQHGGTAIITRRACGLGAAPSRYPSGGSPAIARRGACRQVRSTDRLGRWSRVERWPRRPYPGEDSTSLVSVRSSIV